MDHGDAVARSRAAGQQGSNEASCCRIQISLYLSEEQLFVTRKQRHGCSYGCDSRTPSGTRPGLRPG
jgi:hypothetical protein